MTKIIATQRFLFSNARIAILAFITTIIISGCCANSNSQHYALEAGTPDLDVGDRLKYVGPDSSKTYVVTFTGFKNEVEENNDWCRTKVYYQVYYIILTPATNSEFTEPYFTINIKSGGKGRTFAIKDKEINPTEIDRLSNFVVNGIQYGGISVYADSEQQTEVDTIFYHGEYGIIGYVTDNGNRYLLNR